MNYTSKTFIKKYIDYHSIILAIIYSLITILGFSYDKLNSWNMITNNFLYTISAIILLTIIYFFIIYILNKYFNKKYTKLPSKISTVIFENKAFIFPFVIILTCWLPYLIIKYPGSPGWDFYHYLNNYYSYDNVLTQHFPLIYVLASMQYIKFGLFIKNVNIMLFLLTLTHAFIMAYSFAYIFKYLKKWKTPYRTRWLLLIFYSVMPLFPNYATTIYHDTIYASLVLIFSLMLTDLYSDNNKPTKFYLKISLISLLICLTRKNGIYIVFPTNICLLIKFIIKNKIDRKIIKSFFCIIPIVFFFISEAFFDLYYVKTSYLEAMAIPIQTISRYSRYHQNDISKEELDDINGIIDFKKAGEEYEPKIVDKVRNNYANYYATNKEIKDFFKTWGILFLRHPDTYIQATVNNNYPLYYPFTNATFTFFKVKEEENYDTYIEFKRPNNLNKHVNNLKNFNQAMNNVPIIMYIDDPGIYTWIMFYIIMLLFKFKRKVCLPLLPCIITFICCFNAPTINWNTRYLFPIIFSILPLLAFYHFILKKE